MQKAPHSIFPIFLSRLAELIQLLNKGGTGVSYQEILFPFLGGLGIFLFGMKYMGDGLQKSAGDSLREILNTFTSTPLRSVLAGLIVTAIIQSSSGTTVLTVGLVSVGFMSLRQAIGVIMGANVGTTVTVFIIGFNLSSYSLPIIGVGSILLFFSKRERVNNMVKSFLVLVVYFMD